MVFFIFGNYIIDVIRSRIKPLSPFKMAKALSAGDGGPLKYCLFIEKYDIHPIPYRVFVE
jgi:hypothetical protein